MLILLVLFLELLIELQDTLPRLAFDVQEIPSKIMSIVTDDVRPVALVLRMEIVIIKNKIVGSS